METIHCADCGKPIAKYTKDNSIVLKGYVTICIKCYNKLVRFRQNVIREIEKS